ncbi:MAG: hypothetical protein ACRDGK_03935 [Actinomycetota bacterium]
MEALTWVIELGVGVSCLAIAVPAFRSRRHRLVGLVLAVAGMAATVHALTQLWDG